MYVEHWCEEQFKAMTVGGPDFSHNETVSCVLNIFICDAFPYIYFRLYYTLHYLGHFVSI